MSPQSLTPWKAWRVPKVQQTLCSWLSSNLSANNGQPCLATLPSAGSLTEAAERALGHKVVIKRFMVTVWGKTGFLLPEVELAPLIGECSCLMLSQSCLQFSCDAQCSFLVCRMHPSHDKPQFSAGSWYPCCSDIRSAAVQVTVAHETLL